MNKKKKTILVTGGAGFIGSHLCGELLARGHKVISLDNYFTGSEKNHIAGVDYRRGHSKDIAKHIAETPEIVYHLGEYSRVAVSIKEPAVVWDLNIAGTLAVLEFCRQRQCKLVYAGSSTKFAQTRFDGIKGKDLSPYTWAKAANSDLVKRYGQWYGLPYVIVYFYNVYGPGELGGKYGTVIKIFQEKYLAGQPLPVYAPGTQLRNYTHVKDTVAGLVLAGEKGQGDGYDIASDQAYQLIEVAKMFKTEIKILPARQTSRPGGAVNTSKLKALGWQAKHSLADYIQEFLKNNPR